MQMETTQNMETQDPLGLKRFALTESAYDLVNSLIGIYARSIFYESEQVDPDTVRMAIWQERVDALHQLQGTSKWADLFFLEQLITEFTPEYKQAAQQEEERMEHAPKTPSGTVYS